jgi:hypothetical protein
MISKRLKQLVLGSAALAALAFGGSASAGAATSTGDAGAKISAAPLASVRGGSAGAMNHVPDSRIHDLYLTDHEQYLRHHERLASSP